VSVSLNASKLKADSAYQSVQEQSGLFAGDGGFDVQVGHNTDLQGGAIVSEASPENNRLSTDTLSYNSLQNNAKYQVKSKSISFSTSATDGPTQGFGGGFSDEEGEASNTTFAAISEGDIKVRANPNQSLEDLKRSREQAHQVLERIFSEDKIDAAREQVELTQVFAEEAYLVVGDLYSDVDQAEVALDEAKSLKADQATIQRLENQLKDAQSNVPFDKSVAHGLVGGITSILGGGNFAQGALASGLSEAALTQIDDQWTEQPELRNVAAALIGGLAGGEVGALISANADQNNYQVHSAAEREIRRLIRREYFKDVNPNEVLRLMQLLAVNDQRSAARVDTSSFDPKTVQFYERYSALRDYIVTDHEQNKGILKGIGNHLNPVPFTEAFEYDNDKQKAYGEGTENVLMITALGKDLPELATVLWKKITKKGGGQEDLVGVDGSGVNSNTNNTSVSNGSFEAEGDFGPLNQTPSQGQTHLPGGGLDVHEVSGGHLLQKHVGQDKQFLENRIKNENLAAASTFNSLSSAERAVGEVISLKNLKLITLSNPPIKNLF